MNPPGKFLIRQNLKIEISNRKSGYVETGSSRNNDVIVTWLVPIDAESKTEAIDVSYDVIGTSGDVIWETCLLGSFFLKKYDSRDKKIVIP